MEMLGVEIDSVKMTMYIPKLKRVKIKRALLKCLLHGVVMLRDLESLIGKLQNVADLVWPAKAFLRRMREQLYNHIAKYDRKDVIVRLTDWDLGDCRFWVWLEVPATHKMC